MNVISGFFGEYRFLSNFWNCQLVHNGFPYSSVESAYQACKSSDPIIWERFSSMSPKEAKSFGRKITIRPDWDAVKKQIMAELLAKKFAPHSPLAEKLLATGEDILLEINSWGDTYWGISRGRGENVLGFLLMEQRYRLRQAKNGEQSSLFG